MINLNKQQQEIKNEIKINELKISQKSSNQ